MSTRAATLESQLNSLTKQRSELEVRLESEERRLRVLEEQRSKEAAVSEALKKSFAEEVSELKKEKVINGDKIWIANFRQGSCFRSCNFNFY